MIIIQINREKLIRQRIDSINEVEISGLYKDNPRHMILLYTFAMIFEIYLEFLVLFTKLFQLLSFKIAAFLSVFTRALVESLYCLYANE